MVQIMLVTWGIVFKSLEVKKNAISAFLEMKTS
jgi:hypothetical protein